MTDITTPQAHVRWLIAFWVLLAGIAGGLAYALQNIDSHPVTFAQSFSWLITVVVSRPHGAPCSESTRSGSALLGGSAKGEHTNGLVLAPSGGCSNVLR